MLTPEYLRDLPEVILALYSRAEREILADMARRIVTYDYWIPAADWQNLKLREAGRTQDEIFKALHSLTGKTETELKKLMQAAGSLTLSTDAATYAGAGLQVPSIKDSEPLKKLLQAGYRATAQEFTNLCRTTARTATLQFEEALDRAWMKVQSGAFSTDQAISDAVQELSGQGLGSIRYPSGRTDSLETAVRRAVVTGVNQTCGQLQEELADEVGCDLVEVSAHGGARPEHAAWQGKIYSRSGKDPKYPSLRAVTGYGRADGLKGINCRHDFSPWVESAPRVWTDEELAKLEEPKYEYGGKKLTQYEAEQVQRRNEREIRRWKREYAAMDAAGLDTSEAAARLKQAEARQRDFLDKTGMKRQYGREQIVNPASAKAVIPKKAVEIVPRYDTMAAKIDSGEGNAVRYVGKIDIEKYKCVSERITTEEVIMTDERVQHIKDRHPNDFERYSQYIEDIVRSPDYILEANKPNTAFLLKEYTENDERFQLILRLAVEGDIPGYKNSVITFLKVEEKRYKRYLRTKKVLYKFE